MANCTATEVRYIIDTGLPDATLTALITLADEEMTARALTTAEWTANLKKQVSMLLTAELAAMNDTRSLNKAEGQVGSHASAYREKAEILINKASYPALISYNEPIEEEDE